MTLPPAPKAPMDRITLGTHRWAQLIHTRDATFAAACAELASRFDGTDARENAKRVLRIAQAHDAINPRELITGCDILSGWGGMEPAAKMAMVVVLAEIGGNDAIDEDVARVLSARRWR